MTPDELFSAFTFGGGNLLRFDRPDDRTIEFDAELLRVNQPAPIVDNAVEEFILVQVRVDLAASLDHDGEFAGFGAGQDGEISFFGLNRPEVATAAIAGQRCELSFFLHDFANAENDMKFVKLLFNVNEIKVLVKS